MSCATKSAGLLAFVLLLSTLMACGDEPAPSTETARAIKTITITERASGQLRRFAGVVEAADTASVSFQVQGNVQEVNAEVGDRVSQGDVLAVLDERKFRLDVDAAQANVRRAQIELQDAERDWSRFRQVSEINRGAVSGQSIDQAEASYQSARQNLSYATSRLNLAKRNLEETALRAPFDGIVAERDVNPFQEVSRGERMFELNMEGAMEAAISIPESEIDQVYLGLSADIRFPAISGETFGGIVTEVSKVAGTANAFPVKVTIGKDADNTRIRPGITAEVTLVFADENSGAAYLVPLQALAPGGEDGANYVFVFEPESSAIRRTAIASSGFRDNNVIVSKGLEPGDIVAVAGVSFLRDGQKVRLMER